MGVNFFSRKNDHSGGGGPRGGLAKDHTFSKYFFETFPKLRYHKMYIDSQLIATGGFDGTLLLTGVSFNKGTSK